MFDQAFLLFSEETQTCIGASTERNGICAVSNSPLTLI